MGSVACFVARREPRGPLACRAEMLGQGRMHRRSDREINLLPVTADFVAKVENRTTPENLAKGDFQRAVTLRSLITPLRRSVVFFFRGTTWSLTSPRATRVSAP